MSTVISKLHSTLSLNTAGFTTPLLQAKKMAKGFISDIGSMGAGVAGFVGKMALAGGALVGLGSIAGGLGLGVKLASDFEQAEVAFTTMLGSADAAKKLLGDLSSFAASTPFEFPELQDASKKLVAFGSSADQVVPELRAIGDISAGIGQPIGDIAELYGKARVQGRLFAQDINQLVGRGIPIIQELAKQFGVTDGEVKQLVESGQVNFSHLQRAFVSLTSEGGKFAGMMAAQSQTTAGLFSTLKDNIGLTLRDIAADLMTSIDLKGLISEFTAAVPIIKETLGASLRYVTDLVGGLIGGLTAAGAEGGTSGNRIVNSMEGVAKGIAYVADMQEAGTWGWNQLRLGAFKFIAATADGIAYLADLASGLPEWLGGGVATNVKDFAAAYATNMRDEITRLESAINADLVSPSKGEQVRAFFSQVRAQAEAAATATAGITEPIKITDATGTDPQAVKDAEKLADMLAGIDKQLQQMGMSDIEIKVANLTELGATTEQLEATRTKLEQIGRLQREQERGKKITDMLADLDSQVRTFGLSDDERKILDLESLGASPEQIEQAKTSLAELARLRNLDDAKAQGPRLVTVGSAEAQRLAFAASRGISRTDDTPKRQLATQERMARSLETIATNTKPGDADEVEI